jgi:hypothetical protein
MESDWGYYNDWDYVGLSYNPNVTFEFVMKNKHKNWDQVISRGRGIDPEKILKELLKDKHESFWSWEELEKNPNLTLEIISKYKNYTNYPWNVDEIRENEETRYINIGDHSGDHNSHREQLELLQEPVQIAHNLSVDQSVTFEDLNSMHEIIKKDVNYTYFSYNYNITKKIFLENSNLKWSFAWFCSNPSINPLIDGKDVFSLETFNALKRKGYNVKCTEKRKCINCKSMNYCPKCKNCFKCRKFIPGVLLQYNHFTPYVKKWHDIFSNALHFLNKDIKGIVLEYIMPFDQF